MSTHLSSHHRFPISSLIPLSNSLFLSQSLDGHTHTLTPLSLFSSDFAMPFTVSRVCVCVYYRFTYISHLCTTHTHSHTHTLTHTHTNIHTYTHTSMHANMPPHTHTCAHTNVCAHTHTHTHTHAHTHTQT